MSTEQIRELVSHVKTGDQDAFAKIYDEFADRIYAFIRIKTVGENEADDIMQDVFVKAWQGCRKIELKNLNFSAWLYKVASNTINDYYRKKYRTPNIVSIDEAVEIQSKDSPQNNLSEQFSKDEIRFALDKLPTHYKEVIELRFFQNLNINETAQIMRKNSITVRVWQHRAIKQLEQIYKDNE